MVVLVVVVAVVVIEDTLASDVASNLLELLIMVICGLLVFISLMSNTKSAAMLV